MSNILLVDDERSMREALSLAFSDEGYTVDTAEDGYEALSLINEKQYDLVLTDLRMPRMDGLELARSLQKWGENIPVIVLTAHATIENTSLLYKAGIRDLLVKPVELNDLFKTVNKVLKERSGQADPTLELDPQQLTFTEQVLPHLMDAVQALFATVGAKDDMTAGHSARVACYALLLAKKMGLNDEELRNLEFLALLHDIGKLGVPESILWKKTRLSESEEEIYKLHAMAGETILKPLRFLPDGDKVVRHHHEQYNGQGYPDGLSGNAIPRFSRIIAIADFFDLKLSAGTYDTPSQEKCLEKMRQESGALFDPAMLEIFVSTYRAVVLRKTN